MFLINSSDSFSVHPFTLPHLPPPQSRDQSIDDSTIGPRVDRGGDGRGSEPFPKPHDFETLVDDVDDDGV